MSYKGFNLSIQDTIWLLTAVGGWILAAIKSSKRLPKQAQTWLAKFDQADLMKIYDDISEFTSLTDAEKHAKAVELLQGLAFKQFGVHVPASIAGLVVEYAYQTWKKRTAKK